PRTGPPPPARGAMLARAALAPGGVYASRPATNTSSSPPGMSVTLEGDTATARPPTSPCRPTETLTLRRRRERLRTTNFAVPDHPVRVACPRESVAGSATTSPGDAAPRARGPLGCAAPA